jgi:hypothetical protein
MNYTLDRFPTREDRPVLEAFDGLQRLAVATTKLERLLTKLGKKAHDSRQAKKAMQSVVEMATRLEEGEPERDVMGRLMGKVMEMVGKRLIKAIMRPILRFAARMAMNLVRIAARAALRWVIVPLFEAAATAVAAVLTPEVLIGLGIAAAVAGGVALYRKYFAKPEVEEIDTAPTGAVVEELPNPVAAQPKSTLETITESSAVKAIKRAFATQKIYKAKEGKKFTGFGADVDGYIREASTMFPTLPLDVLRGFIKMESGWTGKMSPTGAIGTGQFVASTWNALISKGGAAIGMQPITGIYREEKDAKGRPIRPHVKPNPNGNFRTEEDPRFDKRINTLATALLASQNATLLRQAGLPVTGANLYMMHNIGPGIINVMKGGEASPATLLAMQQNGMKASMSAQDFLEFQIANYERAYREANSATALVTDQPRMAESRYVEPPRKTTLKTAAQSTTPVITSNNSPTDLIKGPGKTLVGLQ